MPAIYKEIPYRAGNSRPRLTFGLKKTRSIRKMNKVPHLVLYIGSLQRGGAERVMTNLAEYFYHEGWKVTFVTTYLYPDEYPLPDAAWKITHTPGPIGEGGALSPLSEQGEGIRRILSGLTPQEESGRLINIWRRIRKLRGIFRMLEPDLILSFLGKNNVMAIQSAKGLGIPVVVSVRSNPSREYADRFLHRQMLRLFPKAAGVVLQTRQEFDYFPEKIRKRAVLLPNSLNPDFMRQPYEGPRRKEIVSVGRLDENKNEEMLLRAFAQIAESHPDWTVRLYGDGDSRKKLEKLSQQLHLENRVFFEGWVGGVADRIQDAGIYVLTSRQEGMPNALLEAMALGIPCVSTDCPCGGPADLITDGENGYLVPVDDQDALSHRLAALMDDPALRQKIGRNAGRVRRLYNPEVINARWKSYLTELLQHSSRNA